MKTYLIIGFGVLVLTCLGMTTAAQEPPTPSPFASISQTLLDTVGGQWEERNGILFGHEKLEDESVKYACSIFQNLSTYPETVKSWEYRYFYCNAPCTILAVSDEYVLASTSTNLIEELRKVSDILATTPITPSKSLERYLHDDCGMVAESTPMKLRKK